MKVMSFNTQHCLNYIERKIDFEIMAKTIKDCEADIVGLNEMYDGGEFGKQTEILSELTGLKYNYFAKAISAYDDAPYGNGFISKIPIVKVEKILIPDPVREENKKHYETRCILKAELENGVNVLVTHFGLVDTEKVNAVKTVIENIEDEKCILMGDFNVQPDDEVLKPIRDRMKDSADLFESPLLSFPSDNPVKKIDYIFASKDLEIISADIPSVVSSDHRPHIAEIKL